MQAMYVFEAGKGINAVKVNANFAELQSQMNTNETNIGNLANTALLKDGSNLTPQIISEFQKQTPNILTGNDIIFLSDNTSNFLTLTGNATISLPSVAEDSYSHTIILIVEGGLFSLNLGTGAHFIQDQNIDTNNTYSVMYVYNKINNSWYYCLTQ